MDNFLFSVSKGKICLILYMLKFVFLLKLFNIILVYEYFY